MLIALFFRVHLKACHGICRLVHWGSNDAITGVTLTSFIFSYQSLNASSSRIHGLSSLNSQPLTSMAQDHLANAKRDARHVHRTSETSEPTHWPPGPAGSMAKGKHTNLEFSALLNSKARQTSINILLDFKARPDLLAFGEVNHTHPQMNTFNESVGSPLPMHKVFAKACQNFSVYWDNPSQSLILGAGLGWNAVMCGNLIVVFVHVPNAVARDKPLTIQFYKNIYSALNGRVPDIIMGDTNQPRAGHTQECVTSALGTGAITYLDAHPDRDIEPFDSINFSATGTNAKLNKKYDLAVYNTRTVEILRCKYVSPHVPVPEEGFSKAVTDHMGVIIKVASLKTYAEVRPRSMRTANGRLASLSPMNVRPRFGRV